MLLYLSSQKFGNDVTVLKKWIEKHNNKILLIFNALDAKGQEKINNNISNKYLLEYISRGHTRVLKDKYFGGNA